jgi:hypothetical protein
MATYCVPRDPITWFVVRARRILLSACTVALVSCGGGQSGPAAPLDSAGLVGPAGADSADGPSISLNPPATVAPSNRIGLTWLASSSLTSFTVFVQRAADQAFEAVDAVVAGQSAQFARGAAYRLDFPTARVRVRGCNGASQCVDSNEQPLVDALLGGLAQLSAEPFGSGFSGVALSADGNTLAVNAPGVTAQCGFGAVVVYQRAANGQWTPEGILEPTAPGTAAFTGVPFALSGDGNTIIVGTFTDSCTGAGCPGAVHVFTRDAQHNWSRQAFIKGRTGQEIGVNVAISHDGNRMVAAGHGIQVFEREAGQWRSAHTIEDEPGIPNVSSESMAISPDGSSIAAQAFFRDGDRSYAVHVYKPCSCADGWQLVAELRPAKSLPEPNDDHFGRALSFSSDGKTLAVGASNDPGDASDNGTTMNSGSTAAGAVYVFAADDGGTWLRRAFLKAKTAPAFDQLGVRVSLSGDGKVLLAGACGFAANANGLRRNHRAGATVGAPPGQDNSMCTFGGSGYVFEADGSGAWSHTAAAIAAPGEPARFGDFRSLEIGNQLTGVFSLSMSADAQTSAFLALVSGDVPVNSARHRVVVH